MNRAPACPGPDRATRTPKFVMPPGACDTHAHLFGPEALYPYSAERSYTPEECTAEDYDDLLEIIRVERAVIVQGGANGRDNRVTLAGIARHRERFRGVAVILAGQAEQTYASLHAQGIRGTRMSTVVAGGAGFSQLERLADETKALGWHVVLHFHAASELLDVVPILERIENPFVLDHMARVTAAEGISSAPFQAILRLLSTGRCYVKLASLYRLSAEPYPHRDMLPMIHTVIREAPERVLWGSNWPHPILFTGLMPNDGDLVDLIPLWAPDPADRHRLLVANPATLYGFPQ